MSQSVHCPLCSDLRSKGTEDVVRRASLGFGVCEISSYLYLRRAARLPVHRVLGFERTRERCAGAPFHCLLCARGCLSWSSERGKKEPSCTATGKSLEIPSQEVQLGSLEAHMKAL